MKKTLLLFIGIILILLFSACSDKSVVSVPDNLFEYALKTEENTLTSNSIDIHSSPEEVLDKLDLSTDSWKKKTGNNSSSIIHTIVIEGLSDVIQEEFLFNMDQVEMIRYSIWFEPDEYTEKIYSLQNQATAFLPDFCRCLSENPFAEDTHWVDQKGNMLSLYIRKDSIGTLQKSIELTYTPSRRQDYTSCVYLAKRGDHYNIGVELFSNYKSVSIQNTFPQNEFKEFGDLVTPLPNEDWEDDGRFYCEASNKAIHHIKEWSSVIIREEDIDEVLEIMRNHEFIVHLVDPDEIYPPIHDLIKFDVVFVG